MTDQPAEHVFAKAMESGTVDVSGGVQIYWEAVGSGRPVIFLHGVWASSRFFRRQLHAIGGYHRAIWIDLPSHGRSSLSSDGCTVAGMAAHLHAVITTLGIEKPSLVGWSMRAFSAWDYHQQFGSNDVSGMVVVDQAPTDFRCAGTEDALVGVAELVQWQDKMLADQNGFMRMVLPMMFHTQPTATDAKWMLDEMCRAPAPVAAALFVNQCLRDYRPMIPTYPVPTLIFAGGRCDQPLAAATWLQQNLPDADLKVFENCGHCLFWDEQERFDTRLLEFIGKLPKSALKHHDRRNCYAE